MPMQLTQIVRKLGLFFIMSTAALLVGCGSGGAGSSSEAPPDAKTRKEMQRKEFQETGKGGVVGKAIPKKTASPGR
jgi:hypothetical protein